MLRALSLLATTCVVLAIGRADAAVGRHGAMAFALPMQALPTLRRVTSAGRATGVCGVGMLFDDVVGDFKEGESVKLKKDTWFFHVSPKDYPDGTTIKAGTSGMIKKIILTPDSKATPHRPIQVEFKEPRKWIAHMERSELERH
jgi:hypothetical protein